MQRQGKIIPPQITGASTGGTITEHADSRHEAILLFKEARRRLLDINNWHKLCGEGSALFQLAGPEGNLLASNEPGIGDLIRIDLPATGNKSAVSEWVRIEKFEDEKNLLKDEEIFGFSIRPVKNPADPDKKQTHSYNTNATSTFLVIRNADTVMAMEKGKNEKPNFSARFWFNKMRNLIFEASGIIGLATPQWKSLMNGIIKGQDLRWERKII